MEDEGPKAKRQSSLVCTTIRKRNPDRKANALRLEFANMSSPFVSITLSFAKQVYSQKFTLKRVRADDY